LAYGIILNEVAARSYSRPLFGRAAT